MQRAINGFLPDGTIFGGNAYFNRSTKPLTRVDGSPLVIGDVWKKAGQPQAEWDGTNCISEPIFASSFYGYAVPNTTSGLSVQIPQSPFIPRAVKIISLEFALGLEAANDTNNHWRTAIELFALGTGSTGGLIPFTQPNTNTIGLPSGVAIITPTINQVISIASNQFLQIRLDKIGSATRTNNCGLSVVYAYVL